MKNYVSMLLCCILTITCSRGFSRDTHRSKFLESLHLSAPSLVGLSPGDLHLQTVLHMQLVHIELLKYYIQGVAVLNWNDPANPSAKKEMSLASLINYDTHISKLSSANNGISGFETALPYQKHLSGENNSRDAVRCRVLK